MNVTIDAGQVLFGMAALATAIFPILSWLASRRNAKHIARVDAKADANKATLERVEATTNGLAKRSEDRAHDAGLAQGNLQGRSEQTAERKAEGKE